MQIFCNSLKIKRFERFFILFCWFMFFREGVYFFFSFLGEERFGMDVITNKNYWTPKKMFLEIHMTLLTLDRFNVLYNEDI